MQQVRSDWYKKIWTLDIKSMSWVEQTKKQVDFLIEAMSLSGSEKVLDLACGFGRHSIALAERGFFVVGVDITPAFVEDAQKTAAKQNLPATFICADIRDMKFEEEFDVVLNMADGAIGYLEDDHENLKIFDKISEALKPGGKHFMDICNRVHAEAYFPKKYWEIGEKSISLASFDWDSEKKRMLYGGLEIPFQKIVRPVGKINMHSSIRLYNKKELQGILARRNMKIINTFSNFSGAPDAKKELQLMVYAKKALL